MNILTGLYHADKLDEKTFVENFTIRLKEFQQIIDNLREQKGKPLQHFLITGKRGMGKSTLLRRIYIEVKNTSIQDKMYCVRLGSEQYRLSRLFKLWEQVIAQLSAELPELEQKRKDAEESKQYEERLVSIIADQLATSGKTLLLLIDNFDQFIEKITVKDQHSLRETLMLHPIQIIGNTVFYNEHFYDYNTPFYDFFKTVKLANLTKEESEEFIKERAKSEGIENFEEMFERNKGKISAIRILSGGVPRTLLILLSIISKRNTGDAVDYLHEMIEQVTPLYQDRMKSLSPQQQEIMHHLAVQWDRTPVKDLAAAMRIPSKSISAQLLQLEDNGYINKIDIPGRTHYYEIDERFFNIWLLMSEAAPYDTKRVIWLTKWLDAFYTREELADFATFCENGLKETKPVNRFLIAQALSESEKLDVAFKKQMVKNTARDLKDILTEAGIWEKQFDEKLSKRESELYQEISTLVKIKEFDKVLLLSDELIKLNEPLAFFVKASICNVRSDFKLAEKYYLLSKEKGLKAANSSLGNLYFEKLKDYEKAEVVYREMQSEGSVAALSRLGQIYQIKNDFSKAEEYYEMAEAQGDTFSIYSLGYINLVVKKNTPKAQEYFLKAAEKGDELSMAILGLIFRHINNDLTSAEKYETKVLASESNFAKFFLADRCFNDNAFERKQIALERITPIISNNQIDINNVELVYVKLLLWNQRIDNAYIRIRQLLNTNPVDDYRVSIMSDALQYFLIFRQTTILYQLLQSKEQYKDQFKPVYYALMHEMKEEYPREYLKMPPELKEPVDKILEFVNAERKRLGLE